MADTQQPNIETKIPLAGEYKSPEEALEAEKTASQEILKAREGIENNQTTEDAIRAQLAKPGESPVSKEFRDDVMDPLAEGKLPLGESAVIQNQQKMLMDILHGGSEALSNADEVMRAVLEASEKHKENPNLN